MTLGGKRSILRRICDERVTLSVERVALNVERYAITVM